MSEKKKGDNRIGNKRYLIGLADFKAEINAGPEKVKRWKKQGAPISNFDNTYRAKTDEILDWLLTQDRTQKKQKAS